MTERDDAARTTPGRRTLSRRAIARGAALALPAAAGLRLTAAQTTTPAVDATTVAADIAIINGLLAFEHLLAALYDEALTAFDVQTFLDAGNDPALRPSIEQARDAEASHVALLSGLVTDLGGAPAAADRYVWTYAGVPGFLATARSLENSAVGAYAGSIPLVSNAAAIIDLVSIHSVEARHSAYLADRIGVLPFPDPIDQPLTADEVIAILSPFLAGVATTAGATTATTAAPVVVTPPPTATPVPAVAPAATPPAETGAPTSPATTATDDRAATRAARRANRNQNNANAEETPTPATDNGSGGGRNRNRNNAANGGNGGGNGGRNNGGGGGGNGGGRQTPTPAAEASLVKPTAAASEPSADAASQSANGTATEASFGGTPGLDAVLADAASKLGVPVDQIDIVTNEPREWPSAALGCPQPGELYAQVLTPGYVVLLQAGDQRIEYHLDSRGNFVECKST